MSKLYIEVQYDPGNAVVRLSALAGYGEDRYNITRPAPDKETAEIELKSFVGMYRAMGCEIVLPNGKELKILDTVTALD